MVSFYCDENVHVDVASLLIQAGHSARTTVEVGRIGAWDPDQLHYATDLDFVLITHNRRDFHTLHDAWMPWSPFWRESKPHSGILILDQGPLPPIIVAAIQTFLSDAQATLNGLTHDWFARDGGVWAQWRP